MEWTLKLIEQYPVISLIIGGFLAAHPLALFIVNLTKTPTDNKWYGRFYKWVEVLAGIVSQKVKQKGGKQ